MALITDDETDLTRVKPIDPGVADGTKSVEANSTTYTPATRSVDAPTETVAGQVDKLISQDSPLMQRARAGATQTANSRGLINSTMAAQAGEAAVLDAATPIAAADANTYTTAARDNQTVSNAASAQNAEALNKTAQFNAASANELGGQALKGGQATTLANIEASYRQLIQASDAAGKNFSTATTAIAAIQADQNTSVEQKQTAVNKISEMLKASLSITGEIANIDLSGLLDFSV